MSMRIPKYQAWHTLTKKMRPVTDIVLDPELGGVMVWGKTSIDHDTGEHEADKDFLRWEEIELLEFTGLKDKHGNEIYEGDILGFVRNHDQRVSVFWENGSFWVVERRRTRTLKARLVDMTLNILEIIGNIYANPELIPQEE
jgi:uncharacterized phage protein (TIGR01671 family)